MEREISYFAPHLQARFLKSHNFFKDLGPLALAPLELAEILVNGPPSRYKKLSLFGVWRSLVAHVVRDDGVGGSNPLTPTRFSPQAELRVSSGAFLQQSRVRKFKRSLIPRKSAA